jgi:hypothetical protein
MRRGVGRRERAQSRGHGQGSTLRLKPGCGQAPYLWLQQHPIPMSDRAGGEAPTRQPRAFSRVCQELPRRRASSGSTPSRRVTSPGSRSSAVIESEIENQGIGPPNQTVPGGASDGGWGFGFFMPEPSSTSARYASNACFILRFSNWPPWTLLRSGSVCYLIPENSGLQNNHQRNPGDERSQRHGVPPECPLARPIVAATKQHQVVTRPGQAHMTADVEGVLHRVAHAEGALDGDKLGRGEAAPQLRRHARQEAGDKGVAGSAGRWRQPSGNLYPSNIAKRLTPGRGPVKHESRYTQLYPALFRRLYPALFRRSAPVTCAHPAATADAAPSCTGCGGSRDSAARRSRHRSPSWRSARTPP